MRINEDEILFIVYKDFLSEKVKGLIKNKITNNTDGIIILDGGPELVLVPRSSIIDLEIVNDVNTTADYANPYSTDPNELNKRVYKE